MSISNVPNRSAGAARAGVADAASAAAPSRPATAATEAQAPAKPVAAEAPKPNQYLQARPQGAASPALGPSLARPGAPPAAPVKPAETALLGISETRGPQLAAEMRGFDKSIEAKATDGASALGAAAGGVAGALIETKDRVLQRLGDGKISPDEARQALGQVDLLSDALKAVKDGSLTGVRSGGVDLLAPDVKTLQFDLKRGSDTYTVQLRTRPERGLEEGRAGLELSVLNKNGQPVPAGDNASLRLEHSASDQKASVFVSSDLLDRKIDGPKQGLERPAHPRHEGRQQRVPGRLAGVDQHARGLRRVPPRFPEGLGRSATAVRRSGVGAAAAGHLGESGRDRQAGRGGSGAAVGRTEGLDRRRGTGGGAGAGSRGRARQPRRRVDDGPDSGACRAGRAQPRGGPARDGAGPGPGDDVAGRQGRQAVEFQGPRHRAERIRPPGTTSSRSRSVRILTP